MTTRVMNNHCLVLHALRLDESLAAPVHAQLSSQLRLLILGGTLKPGDRLPSVRQLSRSFALNPLTVSKVFATVRREGLVITVQGRGTYVADDAPTLDCERRLALLAPLLDAVVASTHALSLPTETIVRRLEARFCAAAATSNKVD